MKKKLQNKKGLPYRLFEDGGPTKAETFASTANLVGGMANMFDSIAMNISSGIDQSREGVSDQPTQVVEGVLGALTGSHLNKMWTKDAKFNEAKKYIQDLGDVNYNAGSTTDLLNQYNSNGFIEHSNIDTKGSELQSWLFDPASNLIQFISGKKRNNTAADRQRKLNQEIDAANARRLANFENAIDNMEKQRRLLALRTSFAYGGPLFSPFFGGGAAYYDIAKDNSYAKQLSAQSKNSTSFTPIFNSESYLFGEGGGIHIKPSKKGTFKAQATRMGMSVKEAANHILANPDDYSPAMRRKANFAKNFAAEGGLLDSNLFTNGVTMVNAGGTHENNPHEGVQMGVAPDGKPNLVEEGEAIYKDYVFSNRMRVPDEVRAKYKLRGPKNMTFAEAFRSAQKESAERENNSISQNGLDHIAMILARTQEAVRGYEDAQKKAKGGRLFARGSEIKDYDIIEPDWMKPEYDAETDRLVAQYRKDHPETKLPSTGDNWLRYMPAFMNATAVLSDAFNLTNKPTTLNRIPKFNPIAALYLGEYAPVAKWDINYAANQAAALAAATRNAILNSSAPNKWANLLAADYNAQIAQGELLRQAAMDQYQRDIARQTFNRDTNKINSELGFKTGRFNAQEKLAYAQALLGQDVQNENFSNTAMGARAQNLANFSDVLGEMGREAEDREMLRWLIDKGVFGTITAKGGKIRKRKKGLTY